MRLIDRLAIYFFHPRNRLRVNPYFSPFLLVIIVLSISLLLRAYIGESMIFLLFIIPIILSSGYGGFSPGVVATLLSVFSIDFYLAQTHHQHFVVQASYLVRFILFLLIGIFISLLSEVRNIFEKRLDDAIITEQIAKRNAEQQIRIREHFISVASHELKSPITVQKATLQLLRNTALKNDNKEYITYIDKILLQTDKLTNFINDLLDVSKMNSKKFQYRFTHFAIKEAIDDAVDQIQPLLVTHEIKLSIPSNKVIYADKERITQVLTNLLSNAIKYSPEKTIVKIHAKKVKDTIEISVQDFGIGIDKRYKNKIFNRFFRISGSDESSFKGFGLGLYLTSEIIKKHKGKIWVESQIGKGSTFFFTIPLEKVKKRKIIK